MDIQLVITITVSVTTLVNTVVTPLINGWAKKAFTSDKKIDPLTQALSVSNKVGNKIEDIKDRLLADRVTVSQFHNGGTFYPTGKSIQKFSVMYEATSHDVPSIRSLYHQVPVHMFHRSLDEVKRNQYIKIENFSNPLIPTYGLDSQNDTMGAKSMYIFGIFNLDNKFIGILNVFYIKQPKILSEIEINKTIQDVGVIGGYLMNHLSN